MIDEISNVPPQQVITPPNNTVFDKNTENAKSGKNDQKHLFFNNNRIGSYWMYWDHSQFYDSVR